MKRLALGVIGLFFGLLSAEVWVRYSRPQPPPNMDDLNRGQFTQEGQYPHRTSEFSVQVRVNSFGFVDREWGPKSKRRTLLIGDSFVQGAQVPLESGLGRVLMSQLPDQEILSLGVPGAGTTTALELVKRYAPLLEADGIVLGFLLSNDIFNNHPQLDSKADKPYRKRMGSRLAPYHPKSPSIGLGAKYSHLIRWLLRGQQRQDAHQAQKTGDRHPKTFDVYASNPDSTWQEAWQITHLLLTELAEWCATEELPLGIVLIPVQHEVDPILWTKKLREWPSLDHHSVENAHSKALQLTSRLAPTYDLFQDLKADPPTYYFPIDGHWTKEGHLKAAQELAPFIDSLYTPSSEMIK